MKTAQKIWLTRKEAVERGKVGLRTVDRMLAEGTLTRHRRRGRVFIDAVELDAALAPVAESERAS